MNPSTITAPAKERSRSAHGSSTITTTQNKHVSVNGKPIKISTNLGTIIYNIETQFGKLSDLVDQAFKVGKRDGLSEKIIGDIVRVSLKKAKYNRHTFAVLVRDKYPGALQQGHKSGTKSATSGSSNKVSQPTINAPSAIAIPSPTATAAATTIEPVKNDSEDVFAKTYRVRNPFKFEFDPEEKTFEELLTFETDVPRFPPELLLKYTIRLAKVSREKVRQLNAQLEDFTKVETMSALEKESEELKSRVNDDDGAKQ